MTTLCVGAKVLRAPYRADTNTSQNAVIPNKKPLKPLSDSIRIIVCDNNVLNLLNVLYSYRAQSVILSTPCQTCSPCAGTCRPGHQTHISRFSRLGHEQNVHAIAKKNNTILGGKTVTHILSNGHHYVMVAIAFRRFQNPTPR